MTKETKVWQNVASWSEVCMPNIYSLSLTVQMLRYNRQDKNYDLVYVKDIYKCSYVKTKVQVCKTDTGENSYCDISLS